MSWSKAGNIKGPAGTATIPDPLVVNNQMLVGTDFRITEIVGGGKIEVRNTTTNLWSIAIEWTTVPPS